MGVGAPRAGGVTRRRGPRAEVRTEHPPTGARRKKAPPTEPSRKRPADGTTPEKPTTTPAGSTRLKKPDGRVQTEKGVRSDPDAFFVPAAGGYRAAPIHVSRFHTHSTGPCEKRRSHNREKRYCTATIPAPAARP